MKDSREISVPTFNAVQEILFKLNNPTHEEAERGLPIMDAYANGLVQKSLLHAITIRKLYESGKFYSQLEGREHQYVIDPISTISVARAMYESMLTFNHIFINAPNDEEKELRFMFWQLSSLISKDRFTAIDDKRDALFREANRQGIINLVAYINDLPIVSTLCQSSRQKINSKLSYNSEKWEYYIHNNELLDVKGGINGLQDRLNANKLAFVNFYTVLSMNTHPTFNSVDSIIEMYQVEQASEPKNFELMDTTIDLCISIITLIIYDYCSYFPEVKKKFNSLPDDYKELVNSLISKFKGPQFSLD